VLSSVPDEYAGVLWDTLNPFQAGETAAQTFDLIGDRLIHMHIKDGGVAPDPNECRLLGEGRVPMQSILTTIAGQGYDGWLSVEWEKKWQPQLAGPEIALPQYAGKLRAYLQQLA
jgi:sugar phosphate isomerase/epimerase